MLGSSSGHGGEDGSGAVGGSHVGGGRSINPVPVVPGVRRGGFSIGRIDPGFLKDQPGD